MFHFGVIQLRADGSSAASINLMNLQSQFMEQSTIDGREYAAGLPNGVVNVGQEDLLINKYITPSTTVLDIQRS